MGMLLAFTGAGAGQRAWAAASVNLTAAQLLDLFARAQEPWRSFVAYYQVTRQDEVFAPQPWKGAYTTVAMTRCDGRRISERARSWGRIVPGVEKSRDKPYYKSRLFDGQWVFQYDQPYWRLEDQPDPRQGTGLLMLRQHSKPPASLIETLQSGGSGLAVGLGILPHDGKRVDLRLREAASLRVRDKLEPAGWVSAPCYVLESDTPHGRYTLWLDPARGFQMAKAEMRREAGHKRGSWTLKSYECDVGYVEKVRFEKHGNLWAPAEVTAGLDNVFSASNRCSMRIQIKLTKLILNPDHDALRSFVPDDIRDGAKVYWGGSTNANGSLRRCQWRGGQVMDKDGQVLLIPSPRLMEQRSPSKEPLPTPGIRSAGKEHSHPPSK